VGATSQPLGFPAPLASRTDLSHAGKPKGQAVHTGCLSAAPQRFVIGSNSFRSRTCFEVPLRRLLYPGAAAMAKPRPRRLGKS